MYKLLVVLSIVGLSLFLNLVSAEKYVYNMTREEREQSNLMELCYVMKADFTIAALDEFCRMSYGDLDSVYGDKFNGTENR